MVIEYDLNNTQLSEKRCLKSEDPFWVSKPLSLGSSCFKALFPKQSRASEPEGCPAPKTTWTDLGAEEIFKNVNDTGIY